MNRYASIMLLSDGVRQEVVPNKRPSRAGHRAQTTGRGRLGVVPPSNGTRPYNGSSAILNRSKVRAGTLATIGRRRAREPWVR